MDRMRRRENRPPISMLRISKMDRVPVVPTRSELDKPPKEDNRLANWRRWLQIHQSHQERLVANLKRETLDLSLNAHERSREKNETQSIIEAVTKSEGNQLANCRGNAIFYQLPRRVSRIHRQMSAFDKVEEDEEEDIFTLTSRSLKPSKIEIARVAVPNLIRKEKMLLESHVNTRKPSLNSRWDQGDYLQKRMKELKNEIRIIESKKPETDKLMIVGKNFQNKPKEKFIRLPVITVSCHDTRNKLLDYPDERVALKIQDTEFVFERGYYFEKLTEEETDKLRELKEDLKSQKYAYSVFDTKHAYKILKENLKPITWTLTFKTEGDELTDRRLILENKGVQIITVEWRNIAPRPIPTSIPNSMKRSFFFNKNPISILPGQKIELIIWFRSEQPIVATETWEIITEPKIYPVTISLRLWGRSDGIDWKRRQANKRSVIREKVDSGVRRSVIRDIVEEIFQSSTSFPIEIDIPYDKLFLETNLFHARNPGYFYNSVLMYELKCMYTCAVDKENWSLILKELRTILLNLEPDDVQREMMTRFNEICIDSLTPNIFYKPPDYPNRRLIYWILCTFFNKFEDESNFIFSQCCSHSKLNDLNKIEIDFEDSECETENFNSNIDLSAYYEVFYVKIYCLLCDTIDRISAVVN